MKLIATPPQFSLTSPVRRALSPEQAFSAQSSSDGAPRFGMDWKPVKDKLTGLSGRAKIGGAVILAALLGFGGITCNMMTSSKAPTAAEKTASDLAKRNEALDNIMQVLKKPEADKPAFLKPYLESADPDVLQAGIRFVSTLKEPKAQAELLRPLTKKTDLAPAVRKTLVNIVSDIVDPAIKADLLESLVKSGDYK